MNHFKTFFSCFHALKNVKNGKDIELLFITSIFPIPLHFQKSFQNVFIISILYDSALYLNFCTVIYSLPHPQCLTHPIKMYLLCSFLSLHFIFTDPLIIFFFMLLSLHFFTTNYVLVNVNKVGAFPLTIFHMVYLYCILNKRLKSIMNFLLPQE